MTYQFRKATRENSSVLVALAGHTGTGKTKSALRLASGIAGPKGRIVMLDTESGRGTHYSDQHEYDYAEIKPPFSPMVYREAIEAAERERYDVIIVDSMSHEWSGDGGCCDMQAETLERMAGGDVRKMERLTAPSWKDAKLAHKRLMSRLLQTRSTVIFCLRAEPKIKFVKVRGDDGRERTVIEDQGFQPICEKSFMFEMTVSFMINEEHLPVPIKLGDQFKPFFPLDQPITEESGRRLAEWAKGGTSAPPSRPVLSPETRQAMQSPEAIAAGQRAADLFAQADSAGDTRPRMPNGEPVEIVDRQILIGKIKGAADKAGLVPAARRKLAETYLGPGASMDNADPAALQDLLDAIRALQPSTMPR